jgi:hypothetical protein
MGRDPEKRRAYEKEWRLKNKEKAKEYYRDYYHRHKEKWKAEGRLSWAQKNPERAREIVRKSAAKNREKSNERRREREKTLRGFLLKKLGHVKKSKRRSRTLEVTIDINHLLHLWSKQSGKCAISGFPMRFPGGSLFSLTIDRIDPSLGYTEENTQLCCEAINFGKNRYSNQEMIEFWNFREE